ncbi:hypothetical protein BJX99DRAFT_64557 [Aspergillus californicus]
MVKVDAEILARIAASVLESEFYKVPPDLIEAVKHRQAEEVERLLGAKRYPIHQAVIHAAAVTHYDDAVFRVVVKFLAERRRRLINEARLYIPGEELAEHGVPRDHYILDSMAARVALALRLIDKIEHEQLRYFAPEVGFKSSESSVYSLIGSNLAAAEALYEASFTRTDETDLMGYAPVQVFSPVIKDDDLPVNILQSYLEMCTWYRNRGASLDRIYGVAQSTPMHDIASGIGKYFRATMGHFVSNDPKFMYRSIENASATLAIIRPYTPLLQQIVWAKQRDSYSCACSPGGCLPLNILINEILHGQDSPIAICIIIASLSGIMAPSTALGDTGMHLAPAFARGVTFACLNLQHTCQFAPSQLYRIMRTEGTHHVNTQLDELVTESVTKLGETTKPIEDFWPWWRERMKQVKSRPPLPRISRHLLW